MWGFLASARLCVIMSIPPTTTAIINIMEMLTLQLQMDFNRVTIPKTQKFCRPTKRVCLKILLPKMLNITKTFTLHQTISKIFSICTHLVYSN